MSQKVRYHIIVSGLVQGVFFRARMRDKAQELGLTGWVRNLPDGSLEAVFEGEEERVEQIINWAKKGPPGAVVSHLEKIQEEYQGEFKNFEIRYD